MKVVLLLATIIAICLVAAARGTETTGYVPFCQQCNGGCIPPWARCGASASCPNSNQFVCPATGRCLDATDASCPMQKDALVAAFAAAKSSGVAPDDTCRLGRCPGAKDQCYAPWKATGCAAPEELSPAKAGHPASSYCVYCGGSCIIPYVCCSCNEVIPPACPTKDHYFCPTSKKCVHLLESCAAH